ncbi:MAG: cobalt transport protein CbiN [Eubacteriales bacterium]
MQGKENSNMKTLYITLLIIVVLMVAVPFLALKGAEFGGSDDAGSVMVEEIVGEYEPWFTPILESYLDGEIPGEIESLLFCVQTGIGVGIIAFIMGRFVERKKWTDKYGEQEEGY